MTATRNAPIKTRRGRGPRRLHLMRAAGIRLPPVATERVDEPGRVRHDRPRELHASAQVPQPPLLLPLVRLAGVIGEATRDLAHGERPRRPRDLLRVLVRAAERDPCLDPRPRPIVRSARGVAGGHRGRNRGRAWRGPLQRRGLRRGRALRGRFEVAEAPHLEPEPPAELLHAVRGRRPVPAVVRGIPAEAEVAQVRPVRLGRGAPGKLHRPQRRDQVTERVRGRRGFGGAWRAHRGHRHGVSAEAARGAVRATTAAASRLSSPSESKERPCAARARG